MLRRTRRQMIWMVAGTLLAWPAVARPAGEAREDIPITDPALLERLGFPPDATNVYATPGAYEELSMDPAERVALQEARRATRLVAREDAPAGGPYGTATRGYTPVTAYGGIFPRDSATEHTLPSGSGERICVSGHSVFDVPLDGLPHGALLEFVDVWFRDDSADHDVLTDLWRVCQPDFDPGTVTLTALSVAVSTGTPGLAFLSHFVDDDVDLQSCAYFLRVVFGSGGVDCTASAGDLAIQKVRADWLRQVSPAPDEATFHDVATGHPFFRHIEALAASGITGGCGGDNFCPNAPLTRGQMAVFLAKALGLHWGSF